MSRSTLVIAAIVAALGLGLGAYFGIREDSPKVQVAQSPPAAPAPTPAPAAAASFAPAAPAVMAKPGTTEAMLQARVMGQDNAPVTIIEYASFTCLHCATFHGTTLTELKKEYIDTGRVKLIFRDFPFDEAALRASMMARCMPPERYFPMVDTLFRTQNSWAREKDNTAALARMAKLAGMSDDDFKACMANEALLNGIVKTRLDGEKQHGVQSTPSFIIDDKHKLSGVQPLAEFDKIIKPLLPKP